MIALDLPLVLAIAFCAFAGGMNVGLFFAVRNWRAMQRRHPAGGAP